MTIRRDFTVHRDRLRSPYLRMLFEYWEGLRQGRVAPDIADIDALDMPHAALPHVILVDVEHEPLRLRYRLVGSHGVDAAGWDYTGKYVDELDMPVSKFTEGAQRVIQRAVVESRRRDHTQVTSAHLLFAFAQADWDLFAQAMRAAEVNPHRIVHATDEQLRRMPSFEGCAVRISPTAKMVCIVVGHPRLELGTNGLRVRCSTS